MKKLKYDITNQRFGRLLAKKRVENDKFNQPQWLCLCDCGAEIKATSGTLRRGNTRSCGCLLKEFNQGKINDISDQKFGRLLVLKRIQSKRCPTSSNVRANWLCQCDCGDTVEATGGALRSGATKSCGCAVVDARQDQAIYPDLARSYPGLYDVFRDYEQAARRNGRTFALSIDQVGEITAKNCFYCGCKPDREIKKFRDKSVVLYTYNGIDRKDNSRGYEIDNCLPCCFQCNKSKSSLEYEDWAHWIDRLVAYHNSLKPQADYAD